MPSENEIIIKGIVSSIRRLYRAVYLDSFKVSRQFGLTGSQSSVLRALFREGPLSSAELSRQLFMTPSNITGIIDRLEKKNLVQRIRKQGDRRVVLITLSEEGSALSRTLPDPIENKLISGLGDLNSDQVRDLSQAMIRILNLIDAKHVEDVPVEIPVAAHPPPDASSPEKTKT